MKKAILVILVLMSIVLLGADVSDFLQLRGDQITPSVVRQIELNNMRVDGPTFNFSSYPANLPDNADIADPTTGRFYEDIPWNKNFSRHITSDPTDTLYVYWNNTVNFTISQPDPVNNPLALVFTPNTDWNGQELIVLTVSNQPLDGGNRAASTAIIRVTVTPVNDPPRFGFENGYTFLTLEENPIQVNFRDWITCIDSAPTNFDLYVTQGQLSLPYSVQVNQYAGAAIPANLNPTGYRVEFDPQLDQTGDYRFLITAVDKFSNAFETKEIIVRVLPENDAPVIVDFLPQPANMIVDQYTTHNFSVTTLDVDGDVLTNTWRMTATAANGIVIDEIISTTTLAEYTFDYPTIYTLTYTVFDGLLSDTQIWTISVQPVGPQFVPLPNNPHKDPLVVALVPPIEYPDAVIHYTIDGTEPTLASPIYTTPIPLTTDPNGAVEIFYTIKAFYLVPGVPQSQTATRVYRMTGKVAQTSYTPGGGLFYDPISLTITTPNAGATIWYRCDGFPPVPGDGVTLQYTGPIPIACEQTRIIKSIAIRDGWYDSDIHSEEFTITGIVEIRDHVFSPAGGAFSLEPGQVLNVQIQNYTLYPPSATLYYTLNSTEPGPGNPTSLIYTPGAFIGLTPGSTRITIRAFNPDWGPSLVYFADYTITSKPHIENFSGSTSVFSPLPGVYTEAQNVFINTITNPPNALLYYTTDGSEPTQATGTLYNAGTPITVVNLNPGTSTVTTIKVRAYFGSMDPGNIMTGIYTVTGTLPAPVFNPGTSNSQVPIDVTIAVANHPDAVIWFTTNGSDPGPDNPFAQIYNAAITLEVGRHHLRAVAYKADWGTSQIREAFYNIGELPPPSFNPPGGLYYEPQVVTLYIPGIPDAIFYYTLDGTDPTVGSLLYNPATGIPLPLETFNRRIKAIAVKPGWQTSMIEEQIYTVTGTVATPTFDQNAGQYVAAFDVRISCATVGALIYYTTDNSEPTPQLGTLYTGAAVSIPATLTLRARAYKTDYLPSLEATADYIIFGVVGNPSFSPAPGTYQTGQSVFISANPPDAEIWYTTNGAEPAVGVGTLYVSGTPVLITETTTLKAKAFKTGWNPSGTTSGLYTITGQVQIPVFSHVSGSYAEGFDVSISSATPGATIYYTTDGQNPTEASTQYIGVITISANTILKARAYLNSWTPSEIATVSYIINGRVSAPVILPAASTYHVAQTISILAYPNDAQIYYTTDGSDPDQSSTLYEGPFQITKSTLVRARAYKNPDWLPSLITDADYILQVVAPAFDLSAGQYAEEKILNLSVVDPLAWIRYTINGANPDESSILYEGPITINANMTIRARAYRLGWSPSQIVTNAYIINGRLAMPSFSVIATNHNVPFTVTISAQSGANVYYTTDGSIPDASSTPYSGAITIDRITTLKAIATMNNWQTSFVASITYDLYVLPVTISPAGGSFSANQLVSLSTNTPLAAIYYTTDGSIPTEASNLYSGPFWVESDQTITARAFLANWYPSELRSQAYDINIPVPVLAQPQILPSSGVYNSTQTVSITVPGVPAATIYYTIDGTEPDDTSTPYMGSFDVSTNTTVKAIAYLAGFQHSMVTVASYTILVPIETVATPTFSPASGIYPVAQPVTIETDTSGATIRYTTDGNVPDETSTIYTDPILVSSTTTISAIAYKAGMNPSPVSSASYVINIVTPTVENPYFIPGVLSHTAPVNLSIVCNTIGASIRYTTDGTDPSPTIGMEFNPLNQIYIPEDSSLFIKAIAYLDGWNPSAIVSASYTVTGTVAPVSFNPPTGDYTSAQSVLLTTPTLGANIYYTTNGDEPTMASTPYTMPVIVPAPGLTTIKAIAYKPGWVTSSVSSAVYNVTGTVSMGGISPLPGTYPNAVELSLDAAVPAAATVYYTTDGSEPTQASSVYAGPFTINSSASPIVTVKTKAYLAGWLPSATATYTYTFQAEAPLFTPPSGSYASATDVVLTSGTTGAQIYYTTDGSEPSMSSNLFSGLITITTTSTIRAIAYNGNYLPSAITSATYGIGTNLQVVALPEFSVTAGTYQTAQNIGLSTSTPNASIYYTTNGSEPTQASTLYDSLIPVLLHSTVTIKAIAVRDGWIPSQVATATYTVTGQVAPVVFTPAGGNYTTAQNVVLTSATEGAYFRYTTDGSEPDETSQLFTSEIVVSSSLTLKAKAYRALWAASETGTEIYNIYGTTSFVLPVFSPAPGTFDTPQLVSVSMPTPATAQVYYTLDGTDPTPATGTLYTVPILLDGDTTIKVIAYQPNWDYNVVSGTYSFGAAEPTMNPIPGYYADPISVVLSSATAGATIIYTADGSEPSAVNGDIYGAPIPVVSNTTLKAYAIKAGYADSQIVTGTYGIGGIFTPTVASPVFDPLPGTYTSAQNVSISTATAGATIHYTLNGSIPSRTNGIVYSGAIAMAANTINNLRAIAFLDGQFDSPVVSGTYTITGTVADVVFTPAGGTYTSSQQVILTSSTPGAYIHYTTDGSEPDESKPQYINGITVPLNSVNFTIKAKAFRSGWIPSATGTEVFNVTGTISFEQPVFTPAPGNYNNPVNVTLAAVTPPTAAVYYTTDGSRPSAINGTLYTGAFVIDGNTTLTAEAFLDGWQSALVSGDYTFTTAAPSFNPIAGYYDAAQNVVLSSATAGATIRYTIDGSIPTPGYGTVYTTPILVNVNQTIRAIAYKTDYAPSNLVAATYTIGVSIPVVNNPVFTPASGTYTVAQNVEISTTTPAASIRYTTDGSDPSATWGTIYSGAIPVPTDTNLYIKAIAYREGWTSSAIVSANYTITGTVANVSFNPAGGTYTSAQNVVLSTPTVGANIYYTTNGDEPTMASMLYTVPITVALNSNVSIKAKAFRTGWIPSATRTELYNITGKVAFNQPVFTPAPANYSTAQMVTIASPDPADAMVYYTTDGSNPSALNGTLYVAPFLVDQAQTIKAIAIKTDWVPSDLAIGTYSFSAGAPTFLPPGGSYETAQMVALSSITPGAGIRFTTDGSIPSAINGTVYTTPILVNINQTIRAYAFKAGYDDSPVVSQTYAIGTYIPVVATPEFTPISGIYQTAQNVVINVGTPGASIRYTTDGSDPTSSTGTLYTVAIPLPLNSNTTIKAIAYKSEWIDSQIATATYVITNQVAPVVFTPPAGDYTTAQNVVLTSATEGAYFRYTLDGSEPNAGSALYTTAIPVPLYSNNFTIKAKAYKTDWTPSITQTAVYNVTGQVAIMQPIFSVPANTYTTSQSVIINTPVPSDATIHYTTDGSDPTAISPVYVTGMPIVIPLDTTLTIKVIGVKPGWENSPIYSATYTVTGQIALPNPLFNPLPGTYQTLQSITLFTNTIPTGATLRYTLDGNPPSMDSPAYLAPIPLPLNAITTINVRAFKEDWIASPIVSGTYNLTGQLAIAAPVFTPAGGIYTSAQSVSLGSTTPVAAQIHYTLDGSEPTTDSPVYTSPIVMPLASSTTLKAKAFLANWTPSDTYTAVYQITGQVALPAILFDPLPGIYTAGVNVSLINATIPADATLRYTLDGTDPNAGSTVYTTPISITSGTVTIRVRAFKENWLPSEVAFGTYSVTGQVAIEAPVFSLLSGTYTTPQTVSVNPVTMPAGATIHYTTDGSEPNMTSPVYTTAFSIGLNSTLNLKVKAFLANWISSETYSASYIVTGTVAITAPVFSIPGGVYTTAQTVSILAPIPATATVRYTIDGSDPTATSPIYTNPISIPLATVRTIKARAYLADWTPSQVYSATYTITGQITLPTPMFTPAAGTYQSAQTVQLSTATNPSGTILRYTTNGDDPSEDSAAYSALTGIPLAMESGTTQIKVRAYKTDWLPSAIVSATYTITGQLSFLTPVFTPGTGTYATSVQVAVNGTVQSGTTIRYTTDGSEPTATSTVLATGELIALTQLNTVHTVKVKAFKTDWTPSITQTAVYTITGQAAINTPVFSPAPGIYNTAQNVTINTPALPTNAVVRYTTDGTIPTEASAEYTAPIAIPLNSSLVIRARAFSANWTPSEVYIGAYTITGTVLFPTGEQVFTPPAGTYSSAQVVSINTNTTPAGATIRYTLDGSDPIASSPIYTAGIPLGLDSNTTIKVRAFAANWIDSQIYSATYQITGQVAFQSPVFSPLSGTYHTAAIQVTVNSTVQSGTTIRYTTDGTEPTSTSALYDGGIELTQLNATHTVKVKAFKADWIPSETQEAVYYLTGQVLLTTAPFNPAPGTYTTAQSITIEQPVLPVNAVIRYTTDGSEPTAQSPAFPAELLIPVNSPNFTTKLKGFADNWTASETATGVYNITGTVADPVFSQTSGNYTEALSITITSATEGAQIRYTTDGSDPTITSELFVDPILIPELTQNLNIKAKAFKTDWIDSQIVSETYHVLPLPFNVRAFTYTGYIRVLWNVEPVTRNLDGFNIYRKAANESVFSKLNNTLIPVTQTIGGDHYWDDYDIANSMSYQYYVTAVYNGMESQNSLTTTVEFQAQNLEITDSSRAYPNPAESSTTIQIRLSRNDNVQITIGIYDFAGKKVRTLNSSNLNTNLVEIPWDLKNSSGTKVARGTYFARVVANDSANRSEKVIKISVK